MKDSLIILLLISFFNTSNLTGATADQVISFYQAEAKIESQKNEINFWQQRLAAAPQQWIFQVKLAGAYSALFKMTADIDALKKAEILLIEALAKQPKDPSSIQRTLAHNYISQHRFCEALELVLDAYENGSGQHASELMLFDIYAELGDEYEQIRLLDRLSSKRDFDYLIRLAKWEDSQGRLERTISLMEEAKLIAERSQQASLLHWTYSNLGDYYGHAGEIQLAQRHYEQALALNPADWYSMKGLAWILYSYDDQAEEALRILSLLEQSSQDPGIQLLQAEIKEYTGDLERAKALYTKVAQTVSQPAYGPMYHAFLCSYYSERPQFVEQAVAIAREEVRERPVPASYQLLVKALYAQGDLVSTQKLSREKIWHKTYEPGILSEQFEYFKGLNAPYLQEALPDLKEARFELGPIAYKQFLESI